MTVRLFAVLLVLASSVFVTAQPTVYILNVRESAGSWTTPNFLALRIQELLQSASEELGLELSVKTVESIEDWEKLVSEAPQGVVVINAHGELVPVPPKYGVDWQLFYRDLAMNIMYRGWVWVNPVGYGFFYVTYNYTKTAEGRWDWDQLTVDAAGLEVLGGWLGIIATAWPEQAGGTLQVTQVGRHVFDVLGYNLPDTPNAPRPLTTNIPASWYFYVYASGDVTAYSCAAFEIGKGALMWGGWASSPTEQQAMVAAALTLYYLYPAQLEAAQPKPKGLTPEQLILIAWGTVVMIVLLIVVSFLLKRKGR
ncbi:MAG: hypothetical protein NZ954_02020 [Thermofilaceae archaeon]|nr:hypothetical protein [Thermofilaceae archaeon]MCX8180884.1 hypothetical protein [Thermofilaceae archaeon]MDW8003449.1 hypothetical protein [Thermofilaceae archaeon]